MVQFCRPLIFEPTTTMSVLLSSFISEFNIVSLYGNGIGVVVPRKGISSRYAGCGRNLWRRVLLLLGLLHCFTVFAQTSVSGNVSGEVRWTQAGSPYLITGLLVIGDGASLVIDPGTSIYMEANSGVAVRGGNVKATGTFESPIRVLSEKKRQGLVGAPGDWNQWVFEASAEPSRLDNVVFEHGRGLAVYGASPVFNYLDLRNHDGAAITIDLLASPSGVGNRASGNTINGIAVPEGNIAGNVGWGVRGIPYVVGGSGVSVGAPPVISGISPSTVEQGERLTLTVSGSRLTGFSNALFERGVAEISVLPGGDDQGSGLSFSVLPDATPGSISLQAMTDAGPVSLPSALKIESMRVPVVSGMTPRAVSRGQETSVVVHGSSLGAASASIDVPGITLTAQSATRNSLAFRVGVDPKVAAGVYPLVVVNAVGSVPLNLEVMGEAVPQSPLQVVPPIITLAPDATYQSVTLRVNTTAAENRNFSLSIDNAVVAKLRENNLVLPAGQYETSLAIAGLGLGSTVLKISGNDLPIALEIPVVVTSASLVNMRVSPLVGVSRGNALSGNGTFLAFSPILTVNKGSAWAGNSGNTTQAISRPVRVDRGGAWNSGNGMAVSPLVGVIKE